MNTCIYIHTCTSLLHESQLKNFVTSSPLIEVKMEGTEFMIAWQEDLEQERVAQEETERKKRVQEQEERNAREAAAAVEAAEEAERKAKAAATAAEAERVRKAASLLRDKKEQEEMTRLKQEKEEEERRRENAQLESFRAKSAIAKAAREAQLVTSDETKEEQEGRARCYRIQRLVLEISPVILTSVLSRAWELKTGEVWTASSSGRKILNMVRNLGNARSKLGPNGLEKLETGEVDKGDITFFAMLLLDDPSLLIKNSTEANALQALRRHRNQLVHELHNQPALTQQDFDEQWDTVIRMLELLAKYAGKDTPQRLDKETKKILAQGIDAKKQQQFASDFDKLAKLEERQSNVEDRQSSVEGEIVGLKAKMFTSSRAASLVEKTIAAMMQKELSESSTCLEVRLSNNMSYTFDRTSPLGHGAQGTVFKAQNKEDGSLIALKLVPGTSSQMDREHINLKKINHRNVVAFQGHGAQRYKDQDYLFIGMDFVVGTSYDAYLKVCCF